MKILLVDDDPDLLLITGYALQQAGYLVVNAENGRAALEVFEQEQPDLAVIDINLPGINGFELARRLREKSKVPLMMLTARTDEQDVVHALSLGADDYLSKPFSPRVLLARIQALLRRVGLEAQAAVSLGPLSLDMSELKLLGLPDGPVKLTRLESRFLQSLIANGGRAVTTDRLLVHVWGNAADSNRQLLKQLVHRLRQKIETDPVRPRLIRTVPGSGYALNAGDAA